MRLYLAMPCLHLLSTELIHLTVNQLNSFKVTATAKKLRLCIGSTYTLYCGLCGISSDWLQLSLRVVCVQLCWHLLDVTEVSFSFCWLGLNGQRLPSVYVCVCLHTPGSFDCITHTQTHTRQHEKFSSPFSFAIDSEVSPSLQEASVCISFWAPLQGRAFY